MAIEPSVPSGSAMQVRAPDGRALRGMSFGPVGGKPVLFISGAATGSSMYFAGELLSRANIRLLTMSRPGMEGSDPDPDRTLDSTVRDYETFAEAALGMDAISVPVVANSQGSVFGLGAALGGWASRLVLVSPADEVSNPAIRVMLTEDATKLPDLANRDPQAAVEILRSFTAEAMESMVLNNAHDSDRAFYASDGFLSLYRRSLGEGFGNGGQGYVCDTLIAMRQWGLALDAIDVPVTVMFGANDTGHSPDHGQTLARRIPGACRRVIPNAGGALLWTHPKLVLDAITE